jgi:hypothetical protein
MRRLLWCLSALALIGCQGMSSLVPGAASAAASSALSRTAVDFAPSKTYALLIGILEWRDPDLEPFPKENRQDRAFERALLSRGVPRDNIVFLEDRQATLSTIRTALASVMAKAGPGSTLMVYFAGHGMREQGQTYLANHDVDSNRLRQTGFGLNELSGSLIKGWHGERLLLMGDCCHSGALAEVAQAVGQRGIQAASLSSVSPTDGSTERWTFTEALIRAWQGDGRLDRNGDRLVTFDETDAYVHDQMKYGEDQLTHGSRAGGFEAGWRLSAAMPLPTMGRPVGSWSVGDYVECRRGDAWERVQLIGAGPQGAFVDYLTREERWNEWVDPSRLRAVPLTSFTPGQRVQVEYDGEWLPARVQKRVEDYFLFVNYERLQDSDEWVTDRRLRLEGRPQSR